MRVVINYMIRSHLGGARAYLSAMIPEFAKRHEHEFLLLLSRDDGDWEQFDNVSVRRVKPWPGWSWSRLVWENLRMWDFIKDWRPDVVYTPSHTGTILRQCPTVLAMRNMFIPISAGKVDKFRERARYFLLRRLVPRCLKAADHVVAVSEFVREYLTCDLGIDGDRIHVIPHGAHPAFHRVAPAKVRSIQGKEIPDRFVFAPGGYSTYQNPDVIVRAFEQVATDLEGVALVMAGPSVRPSFREWVATRGLRHLPKASIVLLENIGRDDMAVLFNRAEACCFASEVEACPNIVLEALACGSAIVAPNNKPYPEFVGDGGVLYCPRDAESLALQLRRILSCRALRDRLRGKALERSLGFTVEKCVQRTLEMLDAVAVQGTTRM